MSLPLLLLKALYIGAMSKGVVNKIGKKIRLIRKEKSLTLQQVAERSGVSKGLVSRIENFRTIPSVPVLMSIINKGLEEEISVFFSDIDGGHLEEVLIVRKDEVQESCKAARGGVNYFPIVNCSISPQSVTTSILELQPNAEGSVQPTNCYEFKYILEGQLEYKIADKQYSLSAGDSIFFNGNLKRIPSNISAENCRMLVVSFMNK